MDTGQSTTPVPTSGIEQSRFTRQDRWELDDISLRSSGNIAVADHNYMTYRSYMCIYSSTVDSEDKPTLLYAKQFEEEERWPARYISFMEPNSTEIVTCQKDIVQVIDYNRDVVLRSRKVNGKTTCLSVSESQIFIGFRWPEIVNIYDKDLNEIKSIRLKEIKKDWPKEIAAAADRLYVCTHHTGRAIVYSHNNGSILTEYTTGQDYSKAYSITVSVKLDVVAALWDQRQVAVYSFTNNNCLVVFDVEFGATIIRISDQGRIVTGNKDTGEVKIHDLAGMLTFSHLKEILVSRLDISDCEKLIDFFTMGGETLDTILNSDRPTATLLHALEEKGVILPSNVDRLEEAFLGLKMSQSLYQVVNLYQKLRAQITSYDRLLAGLSSHLTASLPADLCDYFDISDEKKTSIISSQNPGLSLLLAIDELGVIKPSEVTALEQPFNKFRLVQAVANIRQYQLILEEEKTQLLQTAPQNLEDKRMMFVDLLKRKIKGWYETTTPVPWKKSCKWKAADLFVGSGLILIDSKPKRSVQNIDEQCKLNYKEIFTHPKLESEIRIILEGDPGAGKTMLSSQLAYDWSQGKVSDVDILIFLPLKLVEDKTLIRAVKEFYIPAKMPISEKDIETIVADEAKTICFLLDGLEEYSTGGRMRTKEFSEVMKVMRKEKHSNCKVVITSRSDFANDLPECPLLRLGRFGETERNSYIEKLLPEDTDKQQKIKVIIEENSFLLDLCNVPLLFVLAVHNIESMNLSEETELDKVSPFMRSMLLTLCSSNTLKHEIDGIYSKISRSEMMTLGELAFNGLCKGHQQLFWQKDFMESSVDGLKSWIDSGILILEEGMLIEEKDQYVFEITKKEAKKGKVKKRKKKKEKRKSKPVQEGNDWEGRENLPLNLSINPRKKIKKKKEMEAYENSPLDLSLKPRKMMKKKKKENEADESLKVIDEMPPAELLGPSTSHGMPHLPVSSHEMFTRDSSVASTSSKVSEMEESPESVSKLESDPPEMKGNTGQRIADKVPLVVKFLHKVIQEWFAATHFCSMMKRCSSTDQFHNYICRQLNHIRPTDLHYILRFTCYLYPPSCHVIMNYLLRSYSKDGSVPPHIMNCIFLCFNEHNAVKGRDMRDVVTDVCKELITIESEDSRLLQQAKSSLLQYASSDGVVIEKLELKDVISAVDKTALTFNSGVQLGILQTLRVIEVSRWDQVLQDDVFNNILKFISGSPFLKEICCVFPSQPPAFLDEETLGNILSKDMKVEWKIGHIVQSLDPKKGEWMVSFQIPGTSTTETAQVSADQANDTETNQPSSSSSPRTNKRRGKYHHALGALKRSGSDLFTEIAIPEKKAKFSPQYEPACEKATEDKTEESKVPDCQPSLETEATMNKTGGVLEIPNTGVVLVVPPDALPSDKKECTVKMKLISHQIVEDQDTTFSSDSSAVVELLPDNLVLQRHVKLMLPHCLVLQEGINSSPARIFLSHHSKGSSPQWKEQTHLPYQLEETTCVILLDSFCWVKYSVNDKIVTAKKLVVYAAAKKLLPEDNVASIAVGYFNDLPGKGSKFLQSNPDYIVSHKKTFFFRKRKRCYPLRFSLDKIFANGWQFPEEMYKDVPYETIASMTKEHQFFFLLEKKDTTADKPLCIFTASQEKGQIPVHLVVYPPATKVVSPPTAGTYAHVPQDQVFLKTDANMSQTGATVEIPDSGIVLEIPPGAFPGDVDQALIQMRIIPNRRVQDEVVSFFSNSSVAVELFPDNLQLQRPVKLKLPHCLELQENAGHSVSIFTKHLSNESQTHWVERTDLKYSLEDSTCIIWVDKFCCVKYAVDDEIVLGKKIVVYAAARKDIQKKEIADVEVGYYPDMPGGGELLRLNPNLVLDFRNILYFKENQNSPLQLSLQRIVPPKWICCFPEQKPQEIPYRIIAWSVEHSCLYIIKKTDEHVNDGNPVCKFTAAQEDGDIPVELLVKAFPQQEDQLRSKVETEQQQTNRDPMTVIFQLLSRRLSLEWLDVGRALGLEDSTLNQIKLDNPSNTKETIYQMLLHWKQTKGTAANYSILKSALERAGRRDLAEEMQIIKDFSET